MSDNYDKTFTATKSKENIARFSTLVYEELKDKIDLYNTLEENDVYFDGGKFIIVYATNLLNLNRS